MQPNILRPPRNSSTGNTQYRKFEDNSTVQEQKTTKQEQIVVGPIPQPKKQTLISFPKRHVSTKILDRSIHKHTSLHSKEGSYALSMTSVGDGPLRGLTYDQIKPATPEKSVFDVLRGVYSRIFPSMLCGCEQSGNSEFLQRTCDTGRRWLKSTHANANIAELKKKYESLLNSQVNSQVAKQIELDLQRTIPLLSKTSTKQADLRNVLRAYSVTVTEIGYLQGMNLIAGSLVFHCDPWVAYHMLIYLFDALNMKDLYLESLTGFHKHAQIIDILLRRTLPDLYTHFCEHNVKVDMYVLPWLYSLFAMMVPIQNMAKLIDKVLSEGWCYIYKLILAYLMYNQELLLGEDQTGIISLLSSQNYKINQETVFELKIEWEELIEAAHNIGINSEFVKDMHMKYDAKHQRFRV